MVQYRVVRVIKGGVDVRGDRDKEDVGVGGDRDKEDVGEGANMMDRVAIGICELVGRGPPQLRETSSQV